VSRLFDRGCRVTAIRQPSGFVASNPQFFETVGSAIEIEGLRIRFKVEKNLGKEPNKCVIKISNLSAHTRAQLEKLPMRVMLHAGYDGVLKLLFTGNLRQTFSEREDRTDIVTTLYVGDGLRAYAHARMNRTYRPPITVKQVLTDAARSMGLQLPPEINQSVELRQALTSGISMHSPTREVLTRLLAPYNYHWSIQNGQLVILRDEEVRKNAPVLVNQSTGLINSPKSTGPPKPRSSTTAPTTKSQPRSEIKFQSLLYPDLLPGQQALVQSEFLDVRLKVLEVTHEGDTHPGGEWVTNAEGRTVR